MWFFFKAVPLVKFMGEKLSLSEENYLKIIYSLQSKDGKGVATSALAKKLKTKAASVSEMVQKLADKNLLVHKKYYGVNLTNSGEAFALKVIRKHRLWETFLVEKLNFSWDEIHDIAEQLEHIQSEKLTNALDQFLGYPKKDPHGDPIPDKKGTLMHTNRLPLSHCEIKCKGKIVGVEDSSSIFLQYLDKENIQLGAEFLILDQNTFDQSFNLKINGKTIKLTAKMANNLYVEKLN